MVDWSKVKFVNSKDIPKGAVQVHMYDFSDVFRPRGHMKKESVGQYLLEKLESAYESWTNPKYGDNPDSTELLNTLHENLKEEMEGAWKKFTDNI